MYICLDCGETFSEPGKRVDRTIEESSGMFPYRCVVELFHVCKWCGSTHIEEAVSCRICGAPMGETQGKFGLCADCEIETDRLFKEHLKTYTQDQIDYLNAQYEGEYFKI